MLRVGLTGDLGSGKSIVARLLAARGATVLSSDDMARTLMEPGEPLFHDIAAHFGPGVVDAAGGLDRAALARLAFDPAQPRVAELNALVHPAVLAAQEKELERLAQELSTAIVVIESALIFSVKTRSVQVARPTSAEDMAEHEPWRSRFDCVVVVTAPRETKVHRFVERAAAGRQLDAGQRERFERDAVQRLEVQAQTPVPEDASILRINNDAGMPELEARVASLWVELERQAARSFSTMDKSA